MKVADLHCDLLSYVGQGIGRADNPEVRCSWPQLKAGKVNLQVMAIYTETGAHSTLSFQKQVDAYQNLPTLWPDHFSPLASFKPPPDDGKIYTLAAIENASGLALEEEPLSVAFRRLDESLELCRPMLYLSLTWNTENRFGGGNKTHVGLKPDGEELLSYLDGKGVAIDLSHTSDPLAADILNWIDRKGLTLTPIASHSNFRSVCHHPRNLTDEIAGEIVSRGGLIGLNFFRHFVGNEIPQSLIDQVKFAKEKGWLNHLCFGADFFCERQLIHLLPSLYPFFVPPFEDASCYPQVLSLLTACCSPNELKQLAHKNVERFLTKIQENTHAHSW